MTCYAVLDKYGIAAHAKLDIVAMGKQKWKGGEGGAGRPVRRPA